MAPRAVSLPRHLLEKSYGHKGAYDDNDRLVSLLRYFCDRTYFLEFSSQFLHFRITFRREALRIPSCNETNQDQNLPSLQKVRIYLMLHTKCLTYTPVTTSLRNFATIFNATLKVYLIKLELGKF